MLKWRTAAQLHTHTHTYIFIAYKPLSLQVWLNTTDCFFFKIFKWRRSSLLTSFLTSGSSWLRKYINFHDYIYPSLFFPCLSLIFRPFPSLYTFFTFSPLCYLFPQLLKRGGECPRDVMVKAMDCGIVVSGFELQSRYYAHFRANNSGKSMNPPFSSSSQLWVK